jgi:hypothetical protein
LAWFGYLLSMCEKRSQWNCEAWNCWMNDIYSRSPDCSEWHTPLIADRRVTCVWVLGSVAPLWLLIVPSADREWCVWASGCHAPSFLAACGTNTRTTNMCSTTMDTISTILHVTRPSKMTKICVGSSPSPSADKVPIKCRNVSKKCRRHYSEIIFLHGF